MAMAICLATDLTALETVSLIQSVREGSNKAAEIPARLFYRILYPPHGYSNPEALLRPLPFVGPLLKNSGVEQDWQDIPLEPTELLPKLLFHRILAHTSSTAEDSNSSLYKLQFFRHFTLRNDIVLPSFDIIRNRESVLKKSMPNVFWFVQLNSFKFILSVDDARYLTLVKLGLIYPN